MPGFPSGTLTHELISMSSVAGSSFVLSRPPGGAGGFGVGFGVGLSDPSTGLGNWSMLSTTESLSVGGDGVGSITHTSSTNPPGQAMVTSMIECEL